MRRSRQGASVKRGVADWEEKLKVLRAIFAADTQRDLVMAVLNKQTDDEEVGRAVGMLKKWTTSMPHQDTGRSFFGALRDRCIAFGATASQETIHSTFLHGSCADMLALLPEAVRDRAAPIVKHNQSGAFQGRSAVHPIWIIPGRGKEDVDLLNPDDEKAVFDQKYHYNTPAATASWRHITQGSGTYQLFTQCKEALDRLTRRPFWAEELGSGRFDRLIFLGAGAPLKEISLLRSAIGEMPKTQQCCCVLVDYSKFMLEVSIKSLTQDQDKDPDLARVALASCAVDFLDMESLMTPLVSLRSPAKNAVWLIPGATFGNQNIKKFLSVISRLALPNDLLVIGTDTVPEEGLSIHEKALLKKAYMDKDVRDLLEVHLHSSWKHQHKNISVAEYQAIVDSYYVDILEIDTPFRGCVSVQMAVLVSSKNRILAESLRFPVTGLAEYAKMFGFNYQFSVDVSESHYKQLVFRAGSASA